jgi:acyl-homoserine-lactone acylase
VVHPLGAAGGHPARGPELERQAAYALRDANVGNTRMMDAALAFARARSVDDMRQAHAGLGLPWVNTLAADRHGRVLYADVSVVPDVDAAQLERCAQQARRRAAHGRRAGGAQWLAGRLRLATRPPLARSGADPH